MPYATLEDLIERAGEAEIRQIADRDRDGTIDAAVVDRALTDADNLVNGYVATRYPGNVPLTTVPGLVRTWAVVIARYYLHHNGAPDHVRRDYDDAIAALKDVAAGRGSLPVEAGEASLTAGTGTVQASHPPQVFTDQKLQGWR